MKMAEKINKYLNERAGQGHIIGKENLLKTECPHCDKVTTHVMRKGHDMPSFVHNYTCLECGKTH